MSDISPKPSDLPEIDWESFFNTSENLDLINKALLLLLSIGRIGSNDQLTYKFSDYEDNIIRMDNTELDSWKFFLLEHVNSSMGIMLSIDIVDIENSLGGNRRSTSLPEISISLQAMPRHMYVETRFSSDSIAGVSFVFCRGVYDLYTDSDKEGDESLEDHAINNPFKLFTGYIKVGASYISLKIYSPNDDMTYNKINYIEALSRLGLREKFMLWQLGKRISNLSQPLLST